MRTSLAKADLVTIFCELSRSLVNNAPILGRDPSFESGRGAMRCARARKSEAEAIFSQPPVPSSSPVRIVSELPPTHSSKIRSDE